jgi:small subunit ribosomal protein S16
VAVKIRLKRMGKIRQPYYRVVVVDARKKRDGRVIEEIGKYHPKEEPSFIEVASERAQYWLGVGAQPSDAVAALLKVTGDWQKFKGLPGTEGTLRTKEPKRDKQELFNEALKDAANEPKGDAVTKKKTTAKKMAASETVDKTAEAKPEAPAAEAKPEAPAAEAPAAEAKPEAPAAEAKPEAPAAEAAPEAPSGVTPAEETPADESPVTTEAAAEADVADAEKTEA